MKNLIDFNSLGCQLDLGDEKRIEVEVDEQTGLWIAVRQIPRTDVWLKGIAGEADFRVRLETRTSGLEVSIDRGETAPWWDEASVPRLGVNIRRRSNEATVYLKPPHPQGKPATILGKFNLA